MVDLTHRHGEEEEMKIISKSAFEEAQYMAVMAVEKLSSRVNPTGYWDAAMACLKEAYGK